MRRMRMFLLLGVSGVMATHQVDLEAENTALKTEVRQLKQQLRQRNGAGGAWVQPRMEDIAASKPNILIIFGDVRPGP